jgi:hypothetical protein
VFVAVDIPAKVIGVVDEMSRTYALSEVVSDDHRKRLVLRRFCIRLDDFTKLAPVWKNRLKGAKGNRHGVVESIKRLVTDYEALLEVVRDENAAHRMIGLEAQLAQFQSQQRSVFRILLDDCISIVVAMGSLDAVRIPTFPTQPLSTSDASRVSSVTDVTGHTRVSTDDLGLGRADTVSLIHTGPYQQKAGQVMGLLEALGGGAELAREIRGSGPYHRDVILQAVTDVISLYDVIYSTSLRDGTGAPIPPAIEVWKTEVPVVRALESLRASISEPKLRGLRDVRNRFGAHVDRASAYSVLCALVSAQTCKDLDELCSAMEKGIRAAMQETITLSHFLIHGQVVSGVAGLAHDPSTPFED